MSSVTAVVMTMPVAVPVVVTSPTEMPVVMMPMSSQEMTVSIAQMDMSAHDRLPIGVAKVAKI